MIYVHGSMAVVAIHLCVCVSVPLASCLYTSRKAEGQVLFYSLDTGRGPVLDFGAAEWSPHQSNHSSPKAVITGKKEGVGTMRINFRFKDIKECFYPEQYKVRCKD